MYAPGLHHDKYKIKAGFYYYYSNRYLLHFGWSMPRVHSLTGPQVCCALLPSPTVAIECHICGTSDPLPTPFCMKHGPHIALPLCVKQTRPLPSSLVETLP